MSGSPVRRPRRWSTSAATDEPAEGSSEDRFDPTPTRDWAADEGELLEENRERGEALEEDRADLTADEADGETSDETTDETVGETSDETVGGDTSSEATSEEPTATEGGHDEGPGDSAARRISEFHELRDGGYGVGSAATLDDGVGVDLPFGRPSLTEITEPDPPMLLDAAAQRADLVDDGRVRFGSARGGEHERLL